MSGLRRTPVSRALHRPNLVLGGEREPVLITAILCAGVGASALNLVSIAIAVSVWIVAAFLLRLMAKADPYMSKVYLRQLHYAPYLPARSRPSRKD